MSTYVVIGTSPVNDTSVAVGPFRSHERASEAWDEVTALGYNAETVEVLPLTELQASDPWDGE